jgi:hypothetical protein
VTIHSSMFSKTSLIGGGGGGHDYVGSGGGGGGGGGDYRLEPLHVKSSTAATTVGGTTTTTMTSSSRKKILNESLNTQYIDIPPEDNSPLATVTRTMTRLLSACVSPRQLLIVLRILKAICFSFLVFTIISDLMYIVFVQLRTSEEVNTKVGGTRDTIIRIYGIFLTILAIMIELDSNGIKYFIGLKTFLPRAFLLFFIATISSSPPIHERYRGKRSSYSHNNLYNYDDDYGDGHGGYSDQQVSQEIPSSTIVFQMVTSIVLYVNLILLIMVLLPFPMFS